MFDTGYDDYEELRRLVLLQRILETLEAES